MHVFLTLVAYCTLQESYINPEDPNERSFNLESRLRLIEIEYADAESALRFFKEFLVFPQIDRKLKSLF